MLNKKMIILLVLLSMITVIFSYCQTNSLFKTVPESNLEDKVNLNDEKLNYDNALSNLKNLTEESHSFGTLNNEKVKEKITSYLDLIGVNYFVQDDIVPYEWLYNQIYVPEEVMFEALNNPESNPNNLASMQELLTSWGIASYDEFMLEIINASNDIEYNSYDEYVREVTDKYYEEKNEIRINNIIVSLGNIDFNKDSVVFSVHYDSFENSFGASDNGMNLAALIENARVLKNKNFENNVYIVLVNGEEDGLFGAEWLMASNIIKNIKLVVNFDNLGAGGHLNLYRYTNDMLVDKYLEAVSSPHVNSFSNDINKIVGGYSSDYEVYSKEYDTMDFALFMDNKNYHTENDKFENVNVVSFKETINTIYELINYFGNDLESYNSSNDLWVLEIMNGVIVKLPQKVYNIGMLVLIVLSILYLGYLVIKKRILKFIINTVLIIFGMVMFFVFKPIVFLFIIPVLLNGIIDLIKCSEKVRNIYYIVTYVMILFLVTELAIKVMVLHILGGLLFIIPILYLSNFVKKVI